eukprot:2097229-Prymnesium_polylepis.1
MDASHSRPAPSKLKPIEGAFARPLRRPRSNRTPCQRPLPTRSPRPTHAPALHGSSPERATPRARPPATVGRLGRRHGGA